MQNKKLTIGIGTYGQNNYIKATLSSIICLLKKYNYIEQTKIIVVNDDNKICPSYSTALQFSKKYPYLIQCIDNQQNLGIQKTYSKILYSCGTEYFMIFDSDDIIGDFNIKQQVEFLENNKQYSGSYGLKHIFDKNGRVDRTYGGFYSIANLDVNMNNNAMLLRVQDAKNSGFYFPPYLKNKELKTYSDIAMWLGMILYKPFYFDQNTRCFGREHEKSYTATNEKFNQQSYSTIVNSLKQYIKQNGVPNLYWKQLKFFFTQLKRQKKYELFNQFGMFVFQDLSLFKYYIEFLFEDKNYCQGTNMLLYGLIINPTLKPYIIQYIVKNKTYFVNSIDNFYTIQNNHNQNQLFQQQYKWFYQFFC